MARKAKSLKAGSELGERSKVEKVMPKKNFKDIAPINGERVYKLLIKT